MRSVILRIVEQLWKEDPRSETTELDSYTKELLVKAILPFYDMVMTAWTIIANVGNGNWQTQTFPWLKATANWRDYGLHNILCGVLPDTKRPPKTERDGCIGCSVFTVTVCDCVPKGELEEARKLIESSLRAIFRPDSASDITVDADC